jgi:hypothetical protein
LRSTGNRGNKPRRNPNGGSKVYYQDSFVYEKCAAKAERNAKRKLIRPDIYNQVLDEALRKGLILEREKQKGPEQKGSDHTQRSNTVEVKPEQASTTTKPAERKRDPVNNDQDWLTTCADAENFLDKAFVINEIGKHGGRTAQEIKQPHLRAAIMQTYRDEYARRQKDKAQTAQPSTAKAEGRPAESLFNGREPGSEG